MPHVAIVIADPDRAHEQEIARHVRANVAAHLPSVPELDRARAATAIERRVREIVGPKRSAGDLHAALATECPDGLPNCRNCGDPDHASTCAAAGHCPSCGTKHGVAPDRIVTANGYAVVAVPAPAPGEEWDRQTRRFAKPQGKP